MSRKITLLAILLAPALASAHFPWMYVSDESYPRVFFGEGIADREYHLPESVEAAEVWQTDIDSPAKKIVMEPFEEEGFIGLEAEDSIEPRGRLQTSVEYGVYHGSKLVYYAQSYPSADPAAWPQSPAKELTLQALPTLDGDKLNVTVLLNGEPLGGAGVTLSHEKGEEGVKATTGDDGVAEFAADQVQEGLNALMVMHVDKSDRGKVGDEAYTSAMHVLTVTFEYDPETATKSAAALPSLPEAVSSFGAASADGWLYVYSGHIGTAHDHSRDNLSKHFRRIRLDGEGGWEELPMGPALQGLALVAHDGKLYRIGGLDARNASGEEEDLHSTDSFACYDPAAGEWTDLPSLPNGRSSHNAVVMDGTLYVAGGWQLSGESEGEWQSSALAFDLTDPKAEWKQLAEPPFKRRALAVSHVDGRVAVLCGMSDGDGISKQTFFYNPADETWTEGPEFPGKPFHSFGLAAWNQDGVLYAGGMEGVLYRLDAEGKSWVKANEFVSGRFFHQLVPDGEGGLLAVAGATASEGHVATVERFELEGEATSAN